MLKGGEGGGGGRLVVENYVELVINNIDVTFLNQLVIELKRAMTFDLSVKEVSNGHLMMAEMKKQLRNRTASVIDVKKNSVHVNVVVKSPRIIIPNGKEIGDL